MTKGGEVRDAIRWILAAALLLAVIGLIADARGDEHHRGDEGGAVRTGAAVVRG